MLIRPARMQVLSTRKRKDVDASSIDVQVWTWSVG